MAKLYPPNIEGTIPAFEGTTLVVPFSMNQAVGATEINSIAIKIKKVNSNEIILTKQTTNFNAYDNCKAVFTLSATEQELFKIGQFYRVQLAYIDNSNTIGYFSTVGVIKYTALPEIELAGLNESTSNYHMYDYIGTYKQTGDPTEKLYSSRLRLYDNNNKLVEDTGEILHSVLNDTIPNEAIENFNLSRDLEENKVYRLLLTMITSNGLEINSSKYRLIQKNNSNLMFDEITKLMFIASPNYEEGYIDIGLQSANFVSGGILSGYYIISRSEVKKPYEWEKIYKFTAKSEPIESFKTIDYTIEQGKHYVYSLQQYNNYGVYSNRLISNEVYADFEDMFLLDGERQLKIRLNPKVSSMKDNLLETKVNTIGSQFPFFTRNGKVRHKEFSLAGLISYQMDDNRVFVDWNQLGIEQSSANLTSENIAAERIFKLNVLDWLNNGKPKILKSPTEGNYIVRLMNVSLSPDDTVGRMLHSFSCTASEMAPFNYDTLVKYNFIQAQDPEKTVSKWKTINFSERDETSGKIVYKTGELLQGQYIYSIKITDMMPGSVIYINDEAFYIGATGAYSAKTSTPIHSIRLPDNAQYTGSLIAEYKDVLYTEFDKVRKIQIMENPLRQFIGNTYWHSDSDSYINIVLNLQDTKTELISIPKIRFVKRGVHKIYVEYKNKGAFGKNSVFYSNGNSLDEKYKIKISDLDKLSLYKVYYSSVGCNITDERESPDLEEKLMYHKNGESFAPYTETYYDPQYDKLVEDSFDLFDVCVNMNWINLEDIEEKIVKGVNFDYVAIGDGVIAEVSYIAQVLDYSYEFEDDKVAPLRKQYDLAYDLYQSHIIDSTYTGDLDAELENLKNIYKQLLEALEIAVVADYTPGG